MTKPDMSVIVKALNRMAAEELGDPYELLTCPKCKAKVARKYFNTHYCPKASK